MIFKITRIAVPVILAAAGASLAAPLPCPSGTVETNRVETDLRTELQCAPIERLGEADILGLSQEAIAALSSADRLRLDKRRRAVVHISSVAAPTVDIELPRRQRRDALERRLIDVAAQRNALMKQEDGDTRLLSAHEPALRDAVVDQILHTGLAMAELARSLRTESGMPSTLSNALQLDEISLQRAGQAAAMGDVSAVRRAADDATRTIAGSPRWFQAAAGQALREGAAYLHTLAAALTAIAKEGSADWTRIAEASDAVDAFSASPAMPERFLRRLEKNRRLFETYFLEEKSAKSYYDDVIETTQRLLAAERTPRKSTGDVTR